MPGMVESTSESVHEAKQWALSHPGQWRAWPIAYRGRDAQRHAAIDRRRLEQEGFQVDRLHATFLDADGSLRIRIRKPEKEETK